MYKIICFKNENLCLAINETQDEVNTLKLEGWTEQGGVSVSSMGIDGLYVVSQAMKK